MGRNSGKTTALDNSTTNALKRKTRNLLSLREFHTAPPGLEPKAEPQNKSPRLFAAGIAPPGLEPGLS